MKNFLGYLFVLLILLDSNSIFPQPKHLNFNKIDIDNGLKSNDIETIFQDSYGFLWFGFKELYRYDSHNIRIYKKNSAQPDSYPANLTFCIFEDSQRNLWVGTNIGLLKYDREHDQFVNSDLKGLGAVRSIVEQKDGILWIGTSTGLYKFNVSGNEISNVNYLEHNKTEGVYPYITTLYLDNDNNLYIGSFTNSILVKFNIEKNTFDYFDLPDYVKGLGEKPFIIKITNDQLGNIWIGLRENGVLKYNLQTQNWQLYPLSLLNSIKLKSQVMSLCALGNGNILIGTNGGGLTFFDTEKNNFNYYKNDIRDDKSLSSDVVTCIYEDPNGIIWVGTQFGGLNYIDIYEKKFKVFQPNIFSSSSLSNKYINDIIEDTNGIIWIATDKGGLNRFDPKSGKFKAYRYDPSNINSIGNNNLTKLAIDKNGNIWSTNWEGGLNKCNPVTGTFTNFWNDPSNPESLGGNNTINIFIDHNQNLWVSNHYGPGPFNQILYNKSHKFQKFPNLKGNEICSNFPVNVYFQDEKNNIWMGGLEGGLDIYNTVTKTYHTYYSNDSLSNTESISYMVNCIFQDNKNQIWVGTENGGLYLFNKSDSTFSNINHKENIGLENVRSILQDDNNNFWFGTSNGLIKYNRNTKESRTYNMEDGLPSNEFIKSSALKAKNGLFYFGTANGFISFNPEKIKDNPIIPPVYILQLKINGKPVIVDSLFNNHIVLKKDISITNKFTLKYNENNFSFSFVGINFTSPGKNQYKYMLEGFNKGWINNDNQKTANYTNIDPGTYTFKVIASNNDEIWNEKGCSVQLKILPPFWKTYWFYLIYVLIFIGIEILTRRVIIERINLLNKIKIEKLQSEMVKKENELDKQRIKFFFNISHEFRTPLTLILGPVENLIEDTKDDLLKQKYLSIKSNADHLLRLVNQLLDLRKLESDKIKLELVEKDISDYIQSIYSSFNYLANKHKITYSFSSESESYQGFFDPNILEKILFNLLSNAFKYTPNGGEISVDVKFKQNLYEHKLIKITIKDSGIGIAKKYHQLIFDRFFQVDNKLSKVNTGTGIGLALAKELIVLHKGTIKVESNLGDGSTFIVELPVDKNSFTDYKLLTDKDLIENNNFSENLLTTKDKIQKITDNFPFSSKMENRFRILVVEDNEEMRSFILSCLSGNFNITEADNGNDALKIAMSELPDLIISDIMMPGIDGMELAHLLKSDERTSHIPIIMLTALSDVDQQVEGFKMGADDYLTKPFNTKLLNARVNSLIENRKKLKILFNKRNLFSIDKISPSVVDNQFLVKAVKIIEENLSEPDFTPELFAQMMALSRVQLYRKIKALTNYPVYEFIKTIRLKKAAEMLTSGNYNVAETAYLVGFKDLTHFSKSFKKTFGVSPSKYNN